VDKVEHLVVLYVKSESVVDSDQRIRVSDCSTVVCDNVRDTSGTQLNLLDLEELVGSFFGGDAVYNKSTYRKMRIFELVREGCYSINHFQTYP
jgi:hypothetical protein